MRDLNIWKRPLAARDGDGAERAGCGRAPGVLVRAALIAASLLATLLVPASPLGTARGLAQTTDAVPIAERHLEAPREEAAELPRREADQAMVDGWPLYRTERGQAAFNAAMATLAATEGAPPQSTAFAGCPALVCRLKLPDLDADGWFPPGRLWLSAGSYVLFVHSPRYRDGREYRRHGRRGMRYLVLHEFHNGTRNVDPYDTISSHSGSVFVPLYMSKEQVDARGRRFIVVVQVAPYDVVSSHATNYGSAGPGIEVAKNVSEDLEPMQGLAGIVVTAMLKAAAPHLEVVNHRGSEGRPMLEVWQERLERIGGRAGGTATTLPFVPAEARRLQTARARLDQLVRRGGRSAPIPVAERGLVPPRSVAAAAGEVRPARESGPELVEPIRPATRRQAPYGADVGG